MNARSLYMCIGAAFAAVAAVAAVSLAGCAAVPTLTFEPDGADAGWATCPDAAPPGTICCGVIACSGTNCAAECPVCEAACDAASLCCAHNNIAVCRAPGSPCN